MDNAKNMILDGVDKFLDTIFEKLDEKGVDVSSYNLDHIGYHGASSSDYDKRKVQFLEISKEVSEAIVGGRRVGIFKLNNPVEYKDRLIPAIEFIEPKEGQINITDGLEHVEFVLTESFEEFLEKYPNLDWDTSKIERPDFPMVILGLGNGLQVKFHPTPVLEIVGEKQPL